MSKQDEVTALREEIKEKEREIYQANKESNAWNKGAARSHANTKISRDFVESQRKEIAALKRQLLKLEKKK